MIHVHRMKAVLTTAAALLLTIALAVPAYAEEGGGRDGGKGGKRKRPHAGKLFEKFDKNKDGSLTSDEVPEKAWARISKADADGDGAVTKAELREAFKKHRGKKGKRGGKLFEKFDKNGDGALTSDEVPEKAWTKISKADADGDGAVTKAELREACKKRRGKKGKRGGKGGGGSSDG